MLISASTLFWMAFTGAVMFDIVLSFFVLLGVAAVVRAASNGGWRPWWAAGAALGLGILTKGPVALLHVLPLALLAPWWRHRVLVIPAAHCGWGRWYAGVALAVLIAAAIALAWAVPAALAGGDFVRARDLLVAVADRVASTTHHLRPAWFYVVALPVLVLPWLLMLPVWRGAAGARARPTRLRCRACGWRSPGWCRWWRRSRCSAASSRNTCCPRCRPSPSWSPAR